MLPRSPSSSTLVMVSKGMPTLVNQAATASLLGASITQRALPSARLAKLRYPLTSGSCCAACANWRIWSAENFPAGRVCVHMNFAIVIHFLFMLMVSLSSQFVLEGRNSQPGPLSHTLDGVYWARRLTVHASAAAPFPGRYMPLSS